VFSPIGAIAGGINSPGLRFAPVIAAIVDGVATADPTVTGLAKALPYLSPIDYERKQHDPGALEHAVVLATVKEKPSGRPPKRAVLDRRCARRPHHHAGRDGRMAPQVPNKEWLEGGQSAVRPDTLVPSSHPSTKPR